MDSRTDKLSQENHFEKVFTRFLLNPPEEYLTTNFPYDHFINNYYYYQYSVANVTQWLSDYYPKKLKNPINLPQSYCNQVDRDKLALLYFENMEIGSFCEGNLPYGYLFSGATFNDYTAAANNYVLNLKESFLDNVEFNNLSLTRLNFEGVGMANVKFKNVTLDEFNFLNWLDAGYNHFSNMEIKNLQVKIDMDNWPTHLQDSVFEDVFIKYFDLDSSQCEIKYNQFYHSQIHTLHFDKPNAQFTNNQFHHCQLNNVSGYHADWQGTLFNHTALNDICLMGGDMKDTAFVHSNVKQAVFSDVFAANMHFNHSTFEDTTFFHLKFPLQANSTNCTQIESACQPNQGVIVNPQTAFFNATFCYPETNEGQVLALQQVPGAINLMQLNHRPGICPNAGNITDLKNPPTPHAPIDPFYIVTAAVSGGVILVIAIGGMIYFYNQPEVREERFAVKQRRLALDAIKQRQAAIIKALSLDFSVKSQIDDQYTLQWMPRDVANGLVRPSTEKGKLEIQFVQAGLLYCAYGMKKPACIEYGKLSEKIHAKMTLEELEKHKLCILAITAENHHTNTHWQYLPRPIVLKILAQSMTAADQQELINDYKCVDHYDEYLNCEFPSKDAFLASSFKKQREQWLKKELNETIQAQENLSFLAKWGATANNKTISLSQAKNAILFKQLTDKKKKTAFENESILLEMPDNDNINTEYTALFQDQQPNPQLSQVMCSIL